MTNAADFRSVHPAVIHVGPKNIPANLIREKIKEKINQLVSPDNNL